VKFKYKTAFYFFLVFAGAGVLLFREDIQGEKQIVLTLIALFAMMFGLYKMTSKLTSNQHNRYDNEDHFNREKYDREAEDGEENVEEINTDKS
jgi:hypothetical protein